MAHSNTNKLSKLALISLLSWSVEILLLCIVGPRFSTLLLFIATLGFLTMALCRDASSFLATTHKPRKHLWI
jgi:hypothetical protein